MPNEPMTLIERLRNPQWDAAASREIRETVLDATYTLKTMREAADILEQFLKLDLEPLCKSVRKLEDILRGA